MLPMPPSVIMQKMMIDSPNVKLSGLTNVWNPANNNPATTGEARAHGERPQLERVRVQAHGFGGHLVLADGSPGPARRASCPAG